MYVQSFLRTTCLTAAAALAGAMGTATAIQASPPMERTVSVGIERSMTAELENLAFIVVQLRHDADRLESLARSTNYWETHGSYLNQVKEHVNRVGAQLQVLEAMSGTAAPWQKEVVASLRPVAAELAGSTTAAIEFLNGNRSRLWAPEYQEHLKNLPVLSGQIHEYVDSHLDAADSRDRIERISIQLNGEES